MRRLLLWLLISVAAWEGFVYLYSRPRFWLQVVRGCTWVGTGALRIYDHQAQADAHPRTGDVITEIEEYLRRERSP